MKILQITDMHLYKDPAMRWRDKVNTHDTFNQVLQFALEKEKPDFILLTGDLSEDGSVESYQKLAEIIDKTDISAYCIPGNHDLIHNMHHVLPSRFLSFQQDKELDHWKIIFLNTVVEDEHHGLLTHEELTYLANALEASQEKNVLIAMHHNPVPSYSAILDKYSLLNAEDFFHVISKYNNVKVVLYGHTHQDFTSYVNNVVFLGCPASCIQFLPKEEKFCLDKLPPGYRWIQLDNAGSFATSVRYL